MAVDYKPFIPSLVLGQVRKRLLAAMPQDKYRYSVLSSALAGSIQAAVALYLQAPSALEKRPEETALVARSKRDFYQALVWTMVRNAAGFAVFFMVWDGTKSKDEKAHKAVRFARNLVAAILSATGYRATTWAIDGRLPVADEIVEGVGKRGGSPYAAVVKQIQISASKAAITMAFLDVVLGNLENDYAEACKKLSIDDAPQLFKIPHPLPPLPIPVSRRPSVLPKTADETNRTTSSTSDDKLPPTTDITGSSMAVSSVSPAAESSLLSATSTISPGPGGLIAPSTEALAIPEPTITKPKSRYRFKPRICIETQETDEEEEIFKVEVRGWRLNIRVMEALSVVLPACTNAGIKVIASSLKTNRGLVSLNLSDNSIGKDGAFDLAEALKFNQTLASLCLGKNHIKDEGAIALAKVLSNYALSHDEIVSRRKMLAELEKQRRDQEEDPIVKKAKGRITTGHGRNSSASAKKSEETLAKKEVIMDAKNAKKGSAAPAGKSPKKGEAPAAKKTPEAAQTAASGKKGAGAQQTPTAQGDDKKGGKDKKGSAPTKGQVKKGKVDETREEQEENVDTNPSIEPMFEHNGQWFVLGNRSINSLNLRQNGITEDGIKAFLDAVTEQESSAENAAHEGTVGLFRLNLQVEGEKAQKEEDVIEEGISVVEEEV
ncbi:hypothetical protein HDV05_003566 [Chytridiales sp. JEL 0842]|nr:hypothetical protein HDV05_003566 [Chytridiales sp. JEL 0842]